jgi:LysM repeat protein
MRRTLPAVLLAVALLIDALLCGFAAGAILISTGVSFYQGWAGITISTVSVVTEVALAGGPTYLPPPTYTVLPTYTPYPTYTPFGATVQMQAATPYPVEELDAGVTPAPTVAPGGGGQEVTYVVQEGDTLETIAADFGVDPGDIINANGLSPENPEINVGDILVIPPAAAPQTTPQATATSGPAPTTPAPANPTPTPSPTFDDYPGYPEYP